MGELPGSQTRNVDRFGVFLPSFVMPDDGPERASGILDFAREVERLGFEVVRSLQERIDAGVQRFMLHTLTPDPDQLANWVEHIIPNLEFPAPRRSTQ